MVWGRGGAACAPSVSLKTKRRAEARVVPMALVVALATGPAWVPPGVWPCVRVAQVELQRSLIRLEAGAVQGSLEGARIALQEIERVHALDRQRGRGRAGLVDRQRHVDAAELRRVETDLEAALAGLGMSGDGNRDLRHLQERRLCERCLRGGGCRRELDREPRSVGCRLRLRGLRRRGVGLLGRRGLRAFGLSLGRRGSRGGIALRGISRGFGIGSAGRGRRAGRDGLPVRVLGRAGLKRGRGLAGVRGCGQEGSGRGLAVLRRRRPGCGRIVGLVRRSRLLGVALAGRHAGDDGGIAEEPRVAGAVPPTLLGVPGASVVGVAAAPALPTTPLAAATMGPPSLAEAAAGSDGGCGACPVVATAP